LSDLMISCWGLVFLGFQASRVQWWRRLLWAIYSFLCGFMLGACVFRVSSFLGFSGGGDCCEQFTVFCVVSCWGLVFLGFQASRVQWWRRFLWAIYSFLGGFMSRACDFRVSSFVGFSGAGDCCAQFTVFCVVSCGGLCF